jgi:hypothetical protein
MEDLVMETPERTVMEHVEQRSEPPPLPPEVAAPASTFEIKNL